MKGGRGATSDQTLRWSLDHLRVGLAVFDADDVLSYCNQHFRYVYRSLHDIDDLVGRHFEDILRILIDNGEIAGELVVQDPEEWIARRLRVHRQRTGQTTERLTDGRWIDIKERLLPDGGVIGLWADATDRIRYQLRLESVMECMADGFAAWNQAGQLDIFNGKFAELYAGSDGPPRKGQGFEEVVRGLARSGLLRLPDEAEDWVRRYVEDHRRSAHQGFLDFEDDRYFIVNERRTLEGSVVTTLTDITKLKEQERELIFRGQSLQRAIGELEMAKAILEQQGQELVAMAEDIDLARQTLAQQKAELERIEARQRAILEAMGDGLVVVDHQGRIESLNPVAERMFGIDAERAAGLFVTTLLDGIDELLADGLRGRGKVKTKAKTGGDGDRRRETTARHRNGGTLPVEVTVADASAGRQRFFVLTLRDISQHKAHEEVLRRSQDILEAKVQERTGELRTEIEEHRRTAARLRLAMDEVELASRAKTEFLANMSHELRTPLNAIIGFSDSIRHETFGALGNTKYGEYVHNIFESGQHLLMLINDILDVSVIEAGKLELFREPLDIPRIIEESLRLIEPRAENDRIKISRSVAEVLPKLFGDRRRVKQVLVNLLSNAVKFTPSGGRIAIAASADGEGNLVLKVSDTGIGMDAAEITTALTPFGQVGSVMVSRGEGTGLGLPLAKSLVEAHGGSLTVASIPGVGTTVSVVLPSVPRG